MISRRCANPTCRRPSKRIASNAMAQRSGGKEPLVIGPNYAMSLMLLRNRANERLNRMVPMAASARS